MTLTSTPNGYVPAPVAQRRALEGTEFTHSRVPGTRAGRLSSERARAQRVLALGLDPNATSAAGLPLLLLALDRLDDPARASVAGLASRGRRGNFHTSLCILFAIIHAKDKIMAAWRWLHARG